MFNNVSLRSLSKCEHPQRIIKQTYKEFSHEGSKAEYFNCGHCSYCINTNRKKKSRKIVDILSSYPENKIYFATFTYDNEHLPLYTYDKSSGFFISNRMRYTKDRKRIKYKPLYAYGIVEGRDDVLDTDMNFTFEGEQFTIYNTRDYERTSPLLYDRSKVREDYPNNRIDVSFLRHIPIGFKNPCFAHLCYEDFSLYLKKVRTTYNNYCKKNNISYGTFKVFFCGEYGPQTLRPHYHAIFCFSGQRDADEVNALVKIISESWSFGHIDKPEQVLSSLSCGQYVANYINVNQLPERYSQRDIKPFVKMPSTPFNDYTKGEENFVTAYFLTNRIHTERYCDRNSGEVRNKILPLQSISKVFTKPRGFDTSSNSYLQSFLYRCAERVEDKPWYNLSLSDIPRDIPYLYNDKQDDISYSEVKFVYQAIVYSKRYNFPLFSYIDKLRNLYTKLFSFYCRAYSERFNNLVRQRNLNPIYYVTTTINKEEYLRIYDCEKKASQEVVSSASVFNYRHLSKYIDFSYYTAEDINAILDECTYKTFQSQIEDEEREELLSYIKVKKTNDYLQNKDKVQYSIL